MKEVDLFHKALDTHLNDSAARFLLSKWLAERGDGRAIGYRYMAESHKHPYQSFATWEWWEASSANPSEIVLPLRNWRKLRVRPARGFPRCKEWKSRRAAENAVCALFFDPSRTNRRSHS